MCICVYVCNDKEFKMLFPFLECRMLGPLEGLNIGWRDGGPGVKVELALSRVSIAVSSMASPIVVMVAVVVSVIPNHFPSLLSPLSARACA